jgi:hypothetical protein
MAKGGVFKGVHNLSRCMTDGTLGMTINGASSLFRAFVGS